MARQEPLQTSIRMSHHAIPPNVPTVVWALIEITSKGLELDKESTRIPVNVGLVLDRSGSMRGEPLEYVKKAASFVVEQVAERDRFALVVFDDEVNVLCPSQQVTNKDLFKSAIGGIQSRGMTNLSGGLLSGCREVLKGVAPGQVNRVVLLTDGQANAGVTDPAILAAKVQSMVAKGVSVSSVGVGQNFNEDLLIAISEAGRGNYYYIKNPDGIPQVFAQELQGLLNVVAQGIRVTIKGGSGSKVMGILGYSAVPVADGLAVDLPDMYENEVKRLVVELVCPALAEGEYELLNIGLEYTDSLGDLDAVKADVKLRLTVADGPEYLYKPNIEVIKQVELTRTAMAKDQLVDALDKGDLDKGREMLQERISALSKIKEAMGGGDPDISEEIERLEQFSRAFSSYQADPCQGTVAESTLRKDLRYESYQQRRTR